MKIFQTLRVIYQDAVILANLNIDQSDSRSGASSPNDSMDGRPCVKGQDYLETINTEQENSQNEPDCKIAELTSNGRFKVFFVPENVVILSNCKLSKAEVFLLSKGLKFCPTANK